MNHRTRSVLLTLLIGVALILGSLLLDQNHTTIASDQPSTDVSLGVNRSQEVVVRFYYDNQEQLDAVAGELDIWEVDSLPIVGPNAGYAIAAVTPSQADWLTVQGYRVEIDQEKTAKIQAPTTALDPRYYFFDNYNNNSNNRYIVNFLQDTNTNYPGITDLQDIGDAWAASHGGHHRDMWILRITNEDPLYGEISAKPTFFMFANIHAREVTTPEMAIRYIKYFTGGYNSEGGYGIDPDITWLVNHHVVYVLVTQNPDGRAIDELNIDAYWRKNVDNDDGCTTSYGVDLNRNSNFKWGCCGGSSGNCSSETYRGPSRSSEPETAAFQAFAATIFQDWNGNNGDDQIVVSPDNASGIFITLHSYADDILWPWGFAPGSAPNNAQLQTIGRKLADITNVMNPTGGIGYAVDGSSDDWVYGKLGVAAFTFEIGPNYGSCGDFFPAYGCQDGIDGMPRNFWAEMKQSFVYANKIAATPYITAYGPDTQSLVVTPSTTPGGLPVDLTGTVLDQRFGNDPLEQINAAEYFIDAPGADGTGIALSPADGAWGQTSENITGVVDTSGLSEGQHYILVHGKGDNNVWGPFTAVFLTITTPDYGVMLTPEADTQQADPGVTVTYELQVSNIGMNSDSYDISVTSAWDYIAPTSMGPLAPGDSAPLSIQITIPADALHGESDIATVTVSSQTSPNSSDSSTLTTTANYYDLVLTPSTAAANGYPGGQVEYMLHLTNQGNAIDTFDITSTNVWPVTVPALVGPIDPGASADISAIVHIPSSALPGEFDLATITGTSQADPTKTQSSSLTTTAIQAGPVVTPATDAKSGNPGATVTYTLVLTNHNYQPDTFAVTSESAWVISHPSTVGPIPANGSMNVTITVTVPVDAHGNDSDTAQVTFTSSNPDLPVATAALTTTANPIFSFTAQPEQDPLTGYGRGTFVNYIIQVTNTGNMADTYNIYVSSSWPVTVPAHVGPVEMGETVNFTASVYVPLYIHMGDTNTATISITSQGNLNGLQVHLHTNTFWYNTFLALTQKP